jgi:hypothetical protein
MRDEKGQFAKGSTGNPLGRPKRADEQYLIDIWTKHGQSAFSTAIQKGERWALKTLVDKLYPNCKPADMGQVDAGIKSITIVKSFSTPAEEQRLLSLLDH